MKWIANIPLLLFVVVLCAVIIGCEDEVKVHRESETQVSPKSQQPAAGQTVYQRSVTVESDDFDDDDDDDDDSVKIHRESETTTTRQEEVVAP